MISFEKYHGTGNDFVIIDDRKTLHNLDTRTIKKLCDRHFGIGADGLIQLRNHKDFDFEMVYYNSDGLESSMCGNGGRCVTAYAHSLGMFKDKTTFLAIDGPHEAKIISTNPYLISLHMIDVNEIENSDDSIYMSTGSPHFSKFVNSVDELNIVIEGRKIRYNSRFKKEGTNVNFIQENNGDLHVRTYERGVEDETLSCGTGVTASVLSAAYSGRKISSGCNVFTPGGKLKVYFRKTDSGFTDVWLEGNAEFVFSGEINL